MCTSCKRRKQVARGLCKSCYNKDYWLRATPELLEKRRRSVNSNHHRKRNGTFKRKIMLHPNEDQVKSRVNLEIQHRRWALKTAIDQIKSSLGCIDCGYNKNPIALDFDHVDGTKTIAISRAVNRCWSLDRVLREIEKCDVRCANCHRIITQERLKSQIC